MKIVKGTENIINKKALFYESCRSFFFNKNFFLQNKFQPFFPTILNFKENIKNLGEFSDIIQKEMFEFYDKKKRKIILNPEYTIPTILTFKKQGFKKICYFSKCFRYQNTQYNVKREFFQLGCEWININKINKHYIIKEFITILNNFIKYIYTKYRITNPKLIIFKYNILDPILLQNIKKIIINQKQQIFCSICQKRQKHNFIRILDCNICSKKINILQLQNMILNNNKYNLHTELNKNFFQIKFIMSLVRGLDYYNDLVFELYNNNSKKSFLSGGFYQIKKNNITYKGFGFALGLERFYNYINEYNNEE